MGNVSPPVRLAIECPIKPQAGCQLLKHSDAPSRCRAFPWPIRGPRGPRRARATIRPTCRTSSLLGDDDFLDEEVERQVVDVGVLHRVFARVERRGRAQLRRSAAAARLDRSRCSAARPRPFVAWVSPGRGVGQIHRQRTVDRAPAVDSEVDRLPAVMQIRLRATRIATRPLAGLVLRQKLSAAAWAKRFSRSHHRCRTPRPGA